MDKENKTYQFFKSIGRTIILDVMGTFAKPAPGIHILNGHRQAGECEPGTFRALLSKLAKDVTFIRIEEAVRMITCGERPDKAMVAFTFDDGFDDCYNFFAPVLEEFGTNAMFFINPNYVEGDDRYILNFNNNIVMTPGKKPMRWDQISELARRGHVIAAHTMDHYMINDGDEETLRYQIESCKEVIEAHTGMPCDYFAFPYGKLSHACQRAIDIACAKYRYVFSQSDYKHYFSFNGTVINRRHFEPFWPAGHVRYFLSCKKS